MDSQQLDLDHLYSLPPLLALDYLLNYVHSRTYAITDPLTLADTLFYLGLCMGLVHRLKTEGSTT